MSLQGMNKWLITFVFKKMKEINFTHKKGKEISFELCCNPLLIGGGSFSGVEDSILLLIIILLILMVEYLNKNNNREMDEWSEGRVGMGECILFGHIDSYQKMCVSKTIAHVLEWDQAIKVYKWKEQEERE